MPVEMLTYAALGVRLRISPAAARSLAKRLRLPCSFADDGKALVSVDLAEIRHKPRPRAARRAGDVSELAAKLVTLQAEIARLEATAAGHRADFEHERERADRLMAELLQAKAETIAATEAKARLEGLQRSGSDSVGSIDNQQQLTRRLGHLAAELVEADRKALRS
jgi:DNA repair exonuclease SbcCD ATPase subunit